MLYQMIYLNQYLAESNIVTLPEEWAHAETQEYARQNKTRRLKTDVVQFFPIDIRMMALGKYSMPGLCITFEKSCA